MINPYASNDVGLSASDSDDSFLILTLILMFLINPFYNAKDSLNNQNYLLMIYYIIAFIVSWAILGGLIYALYFLWTDSRSCPDGHEIFIIQRDLLDIFTPEYTIYGEEAPVANIESEEFPPAVRVDTPVEGLKELFFPNFKFVKPTFPEIYDRLGFEELDFTRLGSLSSLFFPSYSVTQGGTEVAQILYPVTSEEADFWSITGIEKRYVVKYGGETYVSGEELEQLFEGTLIKTLNFYNFNTGDEDDPMAIIKLRQNALGRTGLYTVCIKDDMPPILKELLFATALAYDQHVIEKEKRKN